VSLTAVPADNNLIGYFRIFAKPPGGLRREITMFRGAPITISNLSTSDPFTDTVGSLDLPQVTIFDTPGQGDLDWLVPDSDIDVVWQNTGVYDFKWQWEGFIVSFNFSLSGAESSFSVDLKGALFALDDYLAKPEFPKRPIPYEILIQRAFDQKKHPAGLAPIKVSFPEDWQTRVPQMNTPSYFWFLKPWGVATGQKWTGLVSRSTGSWEPLLTGHVQSLLGVMFNEGNSQWTIRNNGNRRPELFLRQPPAEDDAEIIEVVLGAPGVELSGSRDFTQRANVFYGEGTDLSGVKYSNMQIGPRGDSTLFKPYAFSPLVYPRQSNPQRDRNTRAKERQIRFQEGLDEPAAYKVAQSQLQRFADPGFTGSLTLNTDPRTADGKPFPRMLIKAGRTIRIMGLFSNPDGYLVHVAQSTVNFESLSVSLTIDSKFRDQLTVEEVQARTRDAMDPVRALQVGKYQNLTQDLVLPWSYTEGSGVLPSGGGLNATEFFMERIPSTAEFPYEEWTRKFPPKRYPNYYVRIGPTNTTDSTKNWARRPDSTGLALPIPIRMAQAGTIRLSQIAAYDKDGNVLPVRFHVSIYANNGSGPGAMPKFPDNPEPTGIKYLKPWGDRPVADRPFTVNYNVFQSNPFIKDAWEQVKEDGTIYENDAMLNAKDAELLVGWGNYYEPAGYSPGRASRGADRTGLLVDENQWGWQPSPLIDLLNPANNKNTEDVGMLFVNIYCDEQGDQPVYFMGRFFRVDPGAA